MYRLGGVSFINSLPFFYGRTSPIFEIELDVPSRLNEAARASLREATMISSLAYPFCRDQYEILPDFCIGGDGRIMSIKLYSKYEISQLWRGGIFITSQTGTSSRAYAKICMERYGFDLFKLERKPLREADSVILIGDQAMLFDGSAYPYCYDLGELWRDWAHCQMLYSVFLIKRPLYAELAEPLSNFLDESLKAFYKNPEPVMARALEIAENGLDEALLREYYSRLILKMDRDKFRGSISFLQDNGLI